MAEPAIGEEMVAHRFQAFKDITAGTIGGVAQVLTAMPFDTIKGVFVPLYLACGTVIRQPGHALTAV